MKKTISLIIIIITLTFTAFAQQDADKCNDSPMFPNRMLNYYISECTSNSGTADFILSIEDNLIEHKEGTKTMIHYTFNSASGQEKPNSLQILKNYENAVKDIGGICMIQNTAGTFGTYKIMKDRKATAWVKVECGGKDNNEFYVLTIIKLAVVQQEITSADILTALKTDGHLALYINFETGKSDIKPESENIIEQIAEMLRGNPSLKISIEGHTDNLGNPQANQTLSEKRAVAVMNAVMALSNDKNQLSSKGWGQRKPISDNHTSNGNAQNQRIEIVRQQTL
jgi:OmpA-OmpF porin, OOP family